MKGHIEKRGNKYRYKLHLGKNAVTGKPEQFNSVSFDTEEEADIEMELHKSKLDYEKKLKRMQALMPNVQGMMPAVPSLQPLASTMTVADLLRKWREDSVEVKDRKTTGDQYESIIEGVIIPFLGHIPLTELQRGHLQNWVKSMRENGGRTGKGLAPRTIHSYFARLNTALRYAIKEKLILENPASDVALPPVGNRRSQKVSPYQVKQILDALRGTQYHWITFIGFHTGLRIGEILGLLWKYIDLDAGTLEVAHGLTAQKGNGLVLGPPKTDASRRTIHLNKTTVKALGEHQRRQKAESALLGKRWTTDSPVFVNTKGNFIHGQGVTDAFREVATQLGYKLTFHATRHAHATICLKGGVAMKTVSERLGHSSIVITMDLYAHVLEGMDKEAAAIFDREVDPRSIDYDHSQRIPLTRDFVQGR